MASDLPQNRAVASEESGLYTPPRKGWQGLALVFGRLIGNELRARVETRSAERGRRSIVIRLRQASAFVILRRDRSARRRQNSQARTPALRGFEPLFVAGEQCFSFFPIPIVPQPSFFRFGYITGVKCGREGENTTGISVGHLERFFATLRPSV